MIALADDEIFRQGIALIKNGIPYYCIFGEPKIWSANRRNAAVMILNDFTKPEDDLE